MRKNQTEVSESQKTGKSYNDVKLNDSENNESKFINKICVEDNKVNVIDKNVTMSNEYENVDNSDNSLLTH